VRKQFVKTTESLLAQDPRVVVLLGDIGVFAFRNAFAAYPQRVYNIGICEQAMTSLAAGLAKEGFLPVIHSIAPFVVERCLEQLKVDLCYQGFGAKIVSVGASYDYAALGCTHHCPADVSLLRSLPGMRILTPGTAAEFDTLFRAVYGDRQPAYFRLSERCNPAGAQVTFGKANVVRVGGRGMVLAVGPMLGPVLQATEELDVTVLYYTTVAPFDSETLQSHCLAGNVVVVEPFYVGTLAHDVSSALADRPIRLKSIGVPRLFSSNYGSAEQHDYACGLSHPQIRSSIERFLDRHNY